MSTSRIITILSDNTQDVCTLSIAKLIEDHVPSCQIQSVNLHDRDTVSNSDLLIVCSDDVTIYDSCMDLSKQLYNVPVLFVSKDGDDLVHNMYKTCSSYHDKGHVFDIVCFPIGSHPNIFSNRVSVLLRAREMDRFQYRLWNAINNSWYYAVVLDNEFTVRLCNTALDAALGGNSVGRNWIEFVPSSRRDSVERLRYAVGSSTELPLEFKETVGKLLVVSSTSEERSTKLVRWINTILPVNGHKWLMRIGYPLKPDIPDTLSTIDDIRDYFAALLLEDRRKIETIYREGVIAPAIATNT